MLGFMIVSISSQRVYTALAEMRTWETAGLAEECDERKRQEVGGIVSFPEEALGLNYGLTAVKCEAKLWRRCRYYSQALLSALLRDRSQGRRDAVSGLEFATDDRAEVQGRCLFRGAGRDH